MRIPGFTGEAALGRSAAFGGTSLRRRPVGVASQLQNEGPDYICSLATNVCKCEGALNCFWMGWEECDGPLACYPFLWNVRCECVWNLN
jgi:hypothetical protein